MKLNNDGVKNAEKLIRAGDVDVTSAWEFTTDDDNALLGDNDWKEYSKWHLAIDETANPETKAYYKFPFGKNGKVYRSALIAIRQRAGQFNYTDIFDKAGGLLNMIDEKMTTFEEEKWFTVFMDGKHKNKGAKKEWTKEDVERIYEVNKDREIPLVVSHPSDNLPIFGYVRGLRKKEENGRTILEARLKKISDWFFNTLKKANFDKVSIALENDLATIRHIGFVENPAVEGMPAVEFSDDYVFYIDKEQIMVNEKLENLEKELEQLKREKNELVEKLIAFENEKKEMLIDIKVKELTEGLPPKFKDLATKLIRAIAGKSETIEFEKDEVFENLTQLLKEMPKIVFEKDVARSSQSNENDIDKLIKFYVKQTYGDEYGKTNSSD